MNPPLPSHVPPHEIRSRFSAAMSEMYKREVPLYGRLLEIVRTINDEILQQNPDLEKELGSLDRITQERHGAIRLGTGRELHTIADIFGVMAMHPVGYYDLSVAGLPVHSTAFRPIADSELAHNPFRVFTSLLRLDLLDPEIRDQASAVLDAREIFTPELHGLLRKHREYGGFTEQETAAFITEALKTFQWHAQALVPLPFYEKMLKVNSLLADIVCFRGPHINHLTPRVLDIYRVHQTMHAMQIEVIPEVQGPPENCQILLQQTSFKALNEEISFPGENGIPTPGKHRARFGEIELRACAIKPKGREIYDRLIAEIAGQTKGLKNGRSETEYFAAYTALLNATFAAGFPAWDIEGLRKSQLGYFQYRLRPEAERPAGAPPAFPENLSPLDCMEKLIAEGWVAAIPVTYEDFLPVSAAGIFKSNLDAQSGSIQTEAPNQAIFEASLGRPVLDPFAIYQKQEDDSIARTLEGIRLLAGRERQEDDLLQTARL